MSTLVTEAERTEFESTGRSTPSAPARVSSTPPRLPFWLRPPANRAPKAPRPTPRQARWWIGVAWLVLSVVMLGFVGHVALFGVLQHARSQATGYDELRSSLAQAETPLGQLDVNEKLVPSGTPVALLKIAKLGLTEVVRQGTSSEVTRLGPGHRRDTVMPGQAGTSVIFGRQSTYGGPFGGLAALAPGDTITVTTGQQTHTFTVLGLRRAGDPLPEPLAANAGRLELATADGLPLAPSGVLYVDASLKGKPAETPAFAFSARALDPTEQAMATDPGGWLPLLFMFQWLVVAASLTLWLIQKWGRWQTWIVAGPVLLVLGATSADLTMSLLPNLI